MNFFVPACLPAYLPTAEKEGESEDPTGRGTTNEKPKSVLAFSENGKLLKLQVLVKNYQIFGFIHIYIQLRKRRIKGSYI